jgi:hypothetical protein
VRREFMKLMPIGGNGALLRHLSAINVGDDGSKFAAGLDASLAPARNSSRIRLVSQATPFDGRVAKPIPDDGIPRCCIAYARVSC